MVFVTSIISSQEWIRLAEAAQRSSAEVPAKLMWLGLLRTQ
jgi:hypothetical protein